MDMSKLTNREREIALLLAQGKSQSIIARQLVVSRHTVYWHVKNMREKIGAASAFEIAVRVAQANGQTR
jgi:DNA-binding CsgD family transcriptional regulator